MSSKNAKVKQKHCKEGKEIVWGEEKKNPKSKTEQPLK